MRVMSDFAKQTATLEWRGQALAKPRKRAIELDPRAVCAQAACAQRPGGWCVIVRCPRLKASNK